MLIHTFYKKTIIFVERLYSTTFVETNAPFLRYRKIQKSKGFLIFCGGIERKRSCEMGQ